MLALPSKLRWRRCMSQLGILWLLSGFACGAPKAPQELGQMVVFAEVHREFLLEVARQKWSESLAKKGRRKVIRRGEEMPARFLFSLLREGKIEFLELKARVPARWLAQPLRESLPPPRRIRVAVQRREQSSLSAAVELLFELFWAELSLAQDAWPPATPLLDATEPMAVRILAAQWFGIKAKGRNAKLSRSCLELLSAALRNRGAPDLAALEASSACLARVASSRDVPAILDRMPNGHDRVEMERVELLGKIGGALAVDHLRWVVEQAEERALRSTAKAALERATGRPAS